MEKFKNYGDVDFFDGGCLVREISETEFEVIKCNYDCDKENNYFLTHDIIDITDSWIDNDTVESYAGIATDNAMYTSDIISYYGTQNGMGVMQLSKNEVIEYIQDRYMIDDFEDVDFYYNNF